MNNKIEQLIIESERHLREIYQKQEEIELFNSKKDTSKSYITCYLVLTKDQN